jgi:hypothetical protein
MAATSYNPTYRYGETNPVKVPWKSAVAVNVGDLVFQDDTDSFTVKPAMSLTFQTVIADPSVAPTIADSGAAASPGFGAGNYKAQYTYVTASGLESGPSPASGAVAITATHGITVSGVTLPAGVIGINLYLSAAGGSATTFVQYMPGGSTVTVTGPPQANSPAPPAANGLSALALTQALFAQKFLGVAGQQFDGVNTSAYGINDGTLRVDTGGVYDYPCASATFNQGDLVAVAQDVGSNLAGQKVVLAGTAFAAANVNAFGGAGGPSSVRAIAIGRVAQAYTSATTTVRIMLLATRYQAGIH